MVNEKLTGIERDLVLQYLVDGNVPVTLTPVVEKTEEETVHSLNSKVFPIALKAEHLKVSDEGIIQLENPPQAVNDFAGKNVKVEFYFNRVGLYFISEVSAGKDGLFLSVPKEISRIKDIEEKKEYDFSAVIYLSYNNKEKKESNIQCVPWAAQELFSRPVWKSIPLENQKVAKEYLEDFVSQAKQEKNAGNGIQLIPICNYLTFKKEEKIEAVQNRQKPLNILYVDHERIVLGSTNEADSFVEGSEYGIKLCFTIKNSPILSRDIYVTCLINKVYTNKDNSIKCIDCIYTSMQEEDMRFLFEKATKKHFV